MIATNQYINIMYFICAVFQNNFWRNLLVTILRPTCIVATFYTTC